MAKAKPVKVINKGQMGGIYFLVMIAAAIYFIQHTHGFWGVILALLKSLIWPVFVAYRAFVLMHL